MELARPQSRQMACVAARGHGDQLNASARNLLGELESCTAHLRILCGDEDTDQPEEDANSATTIANECLALLSGIHIDDEKQEQHATCNEVQPPPRASEPELLQELEALATELQHLMTALGASAIEISQDPSVEQSSEDDEGVDSDEAPLSSPRMRELTDRLQRRKSLSFSLRCVGSRRPFPPPSRAIASKKVASEEGKQSPVRRLLSHAAFWRQHQSKSVGQHITRHSTARKIQETERQRHAKAVEYHYRCVPKSRYSQLLKSKTTTPAPMRSVAVPLDHKASYLKRFTSTQPTANLSYEEDITDGLLCGVYLYGRRRMGMLYASCASLEQLKTRIEHRFRLTAPVNHIYREQVSSGSRTFLQRVASFNELQRGDLLCATTEAHQDMAILCSWMKQRQRVTPKFQPKLQASTMKKNNALATESATSKTTAKYPVASSLSHVPPPAPSTKLWDENGRVVSVVKRL